MNREALPSTGQAARAAVAERDVRRRRAEHATERASEMRRVGEARADADVSRGALYPRSRVDRRGASLNAESEQPTGFAALRRQIPGISEKMLTAALADLRAAGLVQRTELRQVDPFGRYIDLVPADHDVR